MLWSASAKTKNPDAVVAFVDWLVNSPEAADLLLAERGMPANGEIQAAIKPQALEGAADRPSSSWPTSSRSSPPPRSRRRPVGG